MSDILARLDPVLTAVSESMRAEVMLIGAYARDIICLEEARLDATRATEDVDVVRVLASADADVYRDAVAGLGRPVGHLGVRFRVEGMLVDVLPALESADAAAAFTLGEGVEWDVRGQFEAFQSARRRRLPSGVVVRVPTLEAMVLLKLVAWDVRRQWTDKDAQDLGMLLTAASAGDYEDECWSLPLLGRFDANPDLVGCALAGNRAHASLQEAASHCRAILEESAGELSRGLQERHGLRLAPQMLDALHAGLAGALEGAV